MVLTHVHCNWLNQSWLNNPHVFQCTLSEVTPAQIPMVLCLSLCEWTIEAFIFKYWLPRCIVWSLEKLIMANGRKSQTNCQSWKAICGRLWSWSRVVRVPLTDSVSDNKPKSPTKPKPVVITGLTVRLTTLDFWVWRLRSTALRASLTHSCKMKLIAKLFEGKNTEIPLDNEDHHYIFPGLPFSAPAQLIFSYHFVLPVLPIHFPAQSNILFLKLLLLLFGERCTCA